MLCNTDLYVHELEIYGIDDDSIRYSAAIAIQAHNKLCATFQPGLNSVAIRRQVYYVFP